VPYRLRIAVRGEEAGMDAGFQGLEQGQALAVNLSWVFRRCRLNIYCVEMLLNPSWINTTPRMRYAGR
jgi:hypothetical protein